MIGLATELPSCPLVRRCSASGSFLDQRHLSLRKLFSCLGFSAQPSDPSQINNSFALPRHLAWPCHRPPRHDSCLYLAWQLGFHKLSLPASSLIMATTLLRAQRLSRDN